MNFRKKIIRYNKLESTDSEWGREQVRRWGVGEKCHRTGQQSPKGEKMDIWNENIWLSTLNELSAIEP